MTKSKDSKCLELPEHLSLEKAPDYWRYSHPSLIKEHGSAKFFTATRDKAVAMAQKANDTLDINSLLEPPVLKPVIPSKPIAFDAVADSEHQYWLHQAHDDPHKGPKASTIEVREQRLTRIKVFFGNPPIHTINTERVAQFYESITSTHEYQKMRYIVASIFNFARAKGKFPDHLVNPGDAAQLRRIPRDTVRQTMEPAQYKAIHQRAPEWIQIAMEIILQTSLRQEDVWQLRWDNIVDNTLHVIPNKSKTSRRKNKGYSYLKFDLGKNPSLGTAIQKAQMAKIRIQGQCEAFKNCPFIVSRTDLKRVKASTKKEHILQITKTVAAHEFKKVRDQVIETTDLFDGWTEGEMPAFHGIRKLSLQCIQQAGASDEFLKTIAGHKDFKLTKEVYLEPNNPAWADCDGFEVRL